MKLPSDTVLLMPMAAFHMVRLEAARSAEPPTISGRAGAKTLMAVCEALRVAIFSALLLHVATKSFALLAQSFGSSPLITRRSNSAARSGKTALYLANFSAQAAAALAPLSRAFQPE